MKKRSGISGQGAGKRSGRPAVCLLAALLAVSQSPAFSAYGETARPEEIEEAVWEKLQDNVMEYDEIPNLVEYYNPTYQNLLTQTGEVSAICEEAAQRLRKESVEFTDGAESLENDKTPMGQTMYAGYKMMEKAYKDTAKEFEKQGRSADRSTKTMRLQILKQLTSGVQQMFILYNQTAASAQLCDTAAELAGAALAAAQTQQSVGMATDADVQSAQQALMSAQNQQQIVRDGMTTLRQNLCLMTGWSYDAEPEIGPVPAPDTARIDAMDPQTDITRAIANNYDIISLRDSMKGAAYSRRRERALGDAQAELKTQLETLYQTVLADRTAWEAAETSLRAAELDMAAADRQYRVGMTGTLQYLQQKIAYLQQETAAANASLALTQSILNYEWAVEGLASLE